MCGLYEFWKSRKKNIARIIICFIERMNFRSIQESADIFKLLSLRNVHKHLKNAKNKNKTYIMHKKRLRFLSIKSIDDCK